MTSDKRLSPKKTTYDTSQMLIKGFFSWWENTKLHNSIFREHVNFGAGFVPLALCDALNFKHLTSIKQAQKQATSGSYFSVSMFEVLFSVTQEWW